MAKRPGKYDHLYHTLTKVKDSGPYQDRVQAMKTELKTCDVCKGTGKRLIGDLETACQWCQGHGKRAMTTNTLANDYVKFRAQKEEAELILSVLNLKLEATTQMLIESQENGDAGWGAYGAADNALRLTNGDGIRLQPEIYPIVTDKVAFRNWCATQHMDKSDPAKIAAIYAWFDKTPLASKFELPMKVMTDLVKDRLLNGLPEPDGVKVFIKTKVVYTPLKTETVSGEATSDETF